MDLFITAIVAFFIELTLHWFPWGLLLRRKLPRLMAYILGVVGMMVPYTFLLVHWRYGQAVMGLWIVIISAGVAVLGSWGLDHVLDQMAKASELQELYEGREAQAMSEEEA